MVFLVLLLFMINAERGGKRKMKTNKAQIGSLMPLITSLVAIGILLVVGFLIMGNVADNAQVSADSNATAAINAVQNATQDIPGWLSIIVITVIGALLIGLVQFFRGDK